MVTKKQFIQNIRDFFTLKGFNEVKTPFIIESPLPEPHINAISCPGGFYRTSPEVFLKILLSDGAGDIFELATCCRADENGRLHKERFSMLEWYAVNAVYTDLIDFVKLFLQNLALSLNGTSKIVFQDREIDFHAPWCVMRLEDAFREFTSTTVEDALEKNLFEEVLVAELEPSLPMEVPVVLTDYPSEFAALSKINEENERFCERWELYIGGIEIANTYTELTNPLDHEKRFTEFNKQRRENGMPHYFVIQEFMDAITRGIPESAGCALGIDRLYMIFNNLDSISDFDLYEELN